MPYVKNENKAQNENLKIPDTPKIRRDRYGNERVYLGALVPVGVWKNVALDCARQKNSISMSDRVREILEGYYAVAEGKKEQS
jgi:hypothetical protein